MDPDGMCARFLGIQVRGRAIKMMEGKESILG